MDWGRDTLRALLYVAAFVVLCHAEIWAQRQFMGFSWVSEVEVGKSAGGLAVGDFNGDKVEDVAAYGAFELTLLYGPSGSPAQQPTIHRFKDLIESILTSDLDGNGTSDLIIITSNPRRLQVYLSERDGLRERWSEPLFLPADKILVEDMNGDRRPDIVLFGKRLQGVAVLLGRGDGTFREPRFILSDYSFSLLVPRDLNVDRSMDMIAFDWIKNELLVFSAIGRLRYGEPSTIQLSSEPSAIAIGFLDMDNNLDILTVHPDSKQCFTFLGDGLDRFVQSQSFSLTSKPTKVFLSDLNEDEKTDITMFSDSGASVNVFLNDSDGEFHHEIAYAAGVRPSDMSLLKGGGSSSLTAVITDQERRSLLYYHSSSEPLTQTDIQTYALGVRPLGIAQFDANNDGAPDLVIVNSNSSSISMFLNKRDGTFFGQISFPIYPNGQNIVPLRSSDSSFALITSHPRDEMVLVSSVSWPSLDMASHAISTSQSPVILSADYDSQSRSISMLLLGLDEISGSAVVASVRQIGSAQFLENRVFPSHNNNVYSADLADLNNDGIKDVIYLGIDSKRNKAAVFVEKGKLNNGFFPPVMSFAIADTGIRDANLWVNTHNAAQVPSLILQYQSQERWLALAQQKNDSLFASVHQKFPQVEIRSRNDLTFADVDGDGKQDMIIANALTKTIQIFFGEGRGRFTEPRRLLSFPSDGGFVVSDFNDDGIPDYAVVYSVSGLLRVYLGR